MYACKQKYAQFLENVGIIYQENQIRNDFIELKKNKWFYMEYTRKYLTAERLLTQECLYMIGIACGCNNDINKLFLKQEDFQI